MGMVVFQTAISQLNLMLIPDYNFPLCFHRTLFRVKPVKETRFFKTVLDVMADLNIVVTFFNGV